MKKILQKQIDSSPEKNIEEISRESFRIKEIKPGNKIKARFTNRNQNDASFGQSYGSYYQVVALEKKFNNSNYFETDNWFNAGKSDYLENLYQSQIKNPERLT